MRCFPYSVVQNSAWRTEGFSDGLFLVCNKATDLYGYADQTGNLVLPCAYETATLFYDGIAVVKANGETVFIDHAGKTLAPYPFDAPESIERLEKRDAYTIVYFKKGPKESVYTVSILDADYKPVHPDVTLQTLGDSESGNTFFFSKNNHVYNYKGEDLNPKLTDVEKGGMHFSAEMPVTSRYVGVIHSIEEMKSNHVFEVERLHLTYYLKLFDVDGTFVQQFPMSADSYKYVRINDQFVALGNINGSAVSLYTIGGKFFYYAAVPSPFDHSVVLYNNYLRVIRPDKTCALFRADGTPIFEFGKWQSIVPTANSELFLTKDDTNWGAVDSSNAELLPRTYNAATNDADSIYKGDSFLRLTEYPYVTRRFINIFTGSEVSGAKDFDMCFPAGSVYGITTENQIIDADFRPITSANYELATEEAVRNGVFLQSKDPFKAIVMADSGVKVSLDEKYVVFDQTPVIRNGRTLVPLRQIFEAFGASVKWDGETQTITSAKGDTTVTMQIGSDTLKVGDKTVTLDTVPQIIGGRTMIPVRAVADAFGIAVDWDAVSRTVLLRSA